VHTAVVIPARSWDDYLALGVTEIREYGSRDIQVMRRMRAMLKELHDEVRPDIAGWTAMPRGWATRPRGCQPVITG
jgi:uncharacterized membrane protein